MGFGFLLFLPLPLGFGFLLFLPLPLGFGFPLALLCLAPLLCRLGFLPGFFFLTALQRLGGLLPGFFPGVPQCLCPMDGVGFGARRLFGTALFFCGWLLFPDGRAGFCAVRHCLFGSG